MKSDKRPMYQVILEDLKDKIITGEISHKDSIPTQIELAKLYQTSEITSRRALVELANEGYIYRVRGKGSFINEEFSKNQNESVNNKLETIYLIHCGIASHVFNHVFFTDLLVGLNRNCTEHEITFRLWNIVEKKVLPTDINSAFVLLSSELDGKILSSDIITGWRQEPQICNRSLLLPAYPSTLCCRRQPDRRILGNSASVILGSPTNRHSAYWQLPC